MNMLLQSLGFDEWFGALADASLQPGQRVGRVMTVDRGAYLVRGEQGELFAELSGKLRFESVSSPELPCVGDWVCIEIASAELAIIHSVLPRKTCLRRKCSGRTVDFQTIATNIDVAFVVQSCHYDFNVRRLERYLVVVNEGRIEPIVALSKTDLVSDEELEGMLLDIKGAGIATRLIPFSNETGVGLNELRSVLEPGKTYCLLGSSGVGKSTIINRLIGHELLDTRDVRDMGKGSHTTTRRQLIVLDNGAMLVDTPGMRELGLLGASDGVEESFADLAELSQSCRFSDCSHMGEPGCAVKKAVEDGSIGEARYQSYIKLRKETEFYDLSYTEKRKKDKEFGKFIKNAKKQFRRR